MFVSSFSIPNNSVSRKPMTPGQNSALHQKPDEFLFTGGPKVNAAKQNAVNKIRPRVQELIQAAEAGKTLIAPTDEKYAEVARKITPLNAETLKKEYYQKGSIKPNPELWKNKQIKYLELESEFLRNTKIIETESQLNPLAERVNPDRLLDAEELQKFNDHLQDVQVFLQREKDEQRASVILPGKKKPEEIAGVDQPGFTFAEIAAKATALKAQTESTLKVADLDWAKDARKRLQKYFDNTEELAVILDRSTRQQNKFANVALDYFTPPGFNPQGRRVYSTPGRLIPVDSPEGQKLKGKGIYSFVG